MVLHGCNQFSKKKKVVTKILYDIMNISHWEYYQGSKDWPGISSVSQLKHVTMWWLTTKGANDHSCILSHQLARHKEAQIEFQTKCSTPNSTGVHYKEITHIQSPAMSDPLVHQ